MADQNDDADDASPRSDTPRSSERSPPAGDKSRVDLDSDPIESDVENAVTKSSGPDDTEFERAGLSMAPTLMDGEKRARSGPLRRLPHKLANGRYEVLRGIGAGGMGEVYLVEDSKLKRRVALKVIREDRRGPEETVKFVEEAQVLAQLEHPNIVPVHEHGVTEQGAPYSTMRYVRGRSLDDVLAGLRRGDKETAREFSLTRLVQIFLQLTQAIQYAHDHGVVHRDLKPANIMLGEHGEVQVLDWGLAEVMRESDVSTDTGSQSSMGRLLGTPAYMSPEQALGEAVDARADIYSLGILLYEMLTLERPHRGKTTRAILVSVVSEVPVAPREVASGRPIPADLERTCLRALAKEPAERHQSAREIYEDVQSWFAAEVDKTKRRAMADERAELGRRKLNEYRRLRRELDELQEQQRRVARKFPDWRPASEKGELLLAEDRVTEARGRLARAASQSVTTLTEALGFHPENGLAREGLANLYYRWFVDAEDSGDSEARDRFRELVSAYHDGKYAKELEGDGVLTLQSEPAGAVAELYRYEGAGFTLVPGMARSLGPTPCGPVTLPMGSYLAVVRADGYREARYPVHISRNRIVDGSVRLFREEEIGEGMVHIPAGTFVQGGDPQARGFPLPRSEPHLDDFFISRDPVTMAEYVEYINDLARLDLDEAVRRSPRNTTGSYLVRTEAGFEMPVIDSEGDRWYPDLPVFQVDFDDARAYCAWRSRRDRRLYRLPSDSEWEKAARGVDGRYYPWGNRFDGSLCNLLTSRADRSGPARVGEFSSDVSVYGVRGMAGNVRDWTASQWTMGEGDSARVTVILRGGSWGNERDFARCAARDSLDPNGLLGYIGFRIACSAPPRDE